jgi:hypothetical protein
MPGRQYKLANGLYGLIRGGLPIGGLSSPAPVIWVFPWALCKVNGIRPGKRQLIRIALQAEWTTWEYRWVPWTRAVRCWRKEIICPYKVLTYKDKDIKEAVAFENLGQIRLKKRWIII